MLNRSSAGVFRHLPLLNWQFFGMVTAALLSAVTPAIASETMASERLRPEPLDEVSSGSVPIIDETPTISDSNINSGSLLAEVSAPSTDAQPDPTLANGADPVIAQVQTELSSADAVEIAPEAVSVMGFGDLEAALETEAVVQPLPSDDLAQVTRVTDFSDVAPSDWAFQALNNLVENYGCMQGYPDSTFRGQRSLTRFEFAAGLNACLDVIVSTINTDISEADLAALRRLQEEFAAELAALTSRVDQLEADTAERR